MELVATLAVRVESQKRKLIRKAYKKGNNIEKNTFPFNHQSFRTLYQEGKDYLLTL